MYDDLASINKKNIYFKAIQKGQEQAFKRILKNNKPFSAFSQLEKTLKIEGCLEFETIFSEPLGRYCIQSFLASIFSLPKAVFVSDVQLYQKLKANSAQLKVARLIYKQFILSDNSNDCVESVFDTFPKFYNKFEAKSKTDESTKTQFPLMFSTGDNNCIGYYNKNEIERIGQAINTGTIHFDLFDNIYNKIMTDLKFDILPRFLKSSYYEKYIRLKSYENHTVTINSFSLLHTLGQGAFGYVNAAIKKDTGKVYAVKCLNKKHLVASEQVKAVIYEKTHLSQMNSPFVTCLKYSFSDKENLYLALDLMQCGDLKQHLNKATVFSEDLARFYAAEILLGLQHIHEKGMIYRDIKLENILLDENGHVKVSDLGLSVNRKKTKGYAGTPGYIAPEIILGEYYDKRCDYFSFGVMIYRFLSGKKPFGEKRTDIDKRVISVEPDYPSRYFTPVQINLIKALLNKTPNKRLGSGPAGIEEIMAHEWFDPIDFGLLAAGYLEPPIKPKSAEGHFVNQHRNSKVWGKKYRRIKITAEIEKKFENFSYVSKDAVQREIVEVLEKIDQVEGSNLDRRSVKKKTVECCALI